MKNIKSFSKYIITGLSILSICLSVLVTFAYITQQEEEEAIQEQTITHQYIITSIDSEGIHGESLKDNTGIFLVSDNIPNDTNININDKIEVEFFNEWDNITAVKVLN